MSETESGVSSEHQWALAPTQKPKQNKSQARAFHEFPTTEKLITDSKGSSNLGMPRCCQFLELSVPGSLHPKLPRKAFGGFLKRHGHSSEAPKGCGFYITFQTLFALGFYFCCSNAKGKKKKIRITLSVTRALQSVSECY